MITKADLRAQLAAAEAALEPFAKVAALFVDRKPQHGDIIHVWEFTSGSAELRVSDCERAAAVLASLRSIPRNTVSVRDE